MDRVCFLVSSANYEKDTIHVIYLYESNRIIFIVHGFNMRKDNVEIILCSVDHTDLYHSTKTQHFRSIQETLLNLGGFNNNPSIVSARMNALNFKNQHPLDKLG